MSVATPNRITVKDAAKAARDFVIAFYADLGEPIANLMIEEAELSSANSMWQITVGFNRTPLASFSRDRIYKIVDINRETGEVQGMRIRQVEAL